MAPKPDSRNESSARSADSNEQLKRKSNATNGGRPGDLNGNKPFKKAAPLHQLRQKRSSRIAMNQAASDNKYNNSAMSTSNANEQHDRVKDCLANNFQDTSRSEKYQNQRKGLVREDEKDLWDAPARDSASKAENLVQEIVFKIREHERIQLFGNLPSETVPDKDALDMGGRFLASLPRIKESKIFDIASKMPKGAHQHLHFNSEIQPEELFPQVRSTEMQDTFYIRSSRPLVKGDFKAFREAEIQFNVLPKRDKDANIFSSRYDASWTDKTKQKPSDYFEWMLWKNFIKNFPPDVPCSDKARNLSLAESWAREKMVITSDRTYSHDQTHNGAWACFNQGTRAFKGLLGFEGVYRWYIGHAMDSMIADGVMYAELRPMLLDKFIPSNDGLRQLNHFDQMTIICEEIEAKKAELKAKDQLRKFPFGLKIIYCTPRSIPREKMKSELEDCLKLKLQFPTLICGFDLVGAEDRPNNISHYADLLLAFTETCSQMGVKIPFMFHAGETLLDTGGSHDPKNSNLYDALLLNAKRIGHGYALLKHPHLIEQYKKHNISLELCPISNELLHLCGNAREHPYPSLLAAGLHCSLNADNPSLFRGATKRSSSLTHEFYQVMVGDPRMSVHGWRQLAEWSLEHSCLEPEQTREAKKFFREAWEEWCQWVIKTYKLMADSLNGDFRVARS